MDDKFPCPLMAKPLPFPTAAKLSREGHRHHNCPVCKKGVCNADR